MNLYHNDWFNNVNASRIVFPDCPKAFVAASTPRPESFNHFWHMVIQEEVSYNRCISYQVTVLVMVVRTPH